MEQQIRTDRYRILRSDLRGYYFEKDDFVSEDHPIRDDAVRAAHSSMQENANSESAPSADEQEWTPTYSRWRHGGWYVNNVRYPSGACGCVSNNYPDKKWRIACDSRRNDLNGPGDYTFPSRDAAARAELALANAAHAYTHNLPTIDIPRNCHRNGHLYWTYFQILTAPLTERKKWSERLEST